MGNANRDVVRKGEQICELEGKLASIQSRVKGLEAARSELNESIQALLATIGGLKVSKRCNASR